MLVNGWEDIFDWVEDADAQMPIKNEKRGKHKMRVCCARTSWGWGSVIES